MSQTGQYTTTAPFFSGVNTLTGNVGGPVGATGNNINIVGAGDITVTGNPGTSTLTITTSGTVADSFTTDSGVAIPVAGNLNILGGFNITTNGAGNTVTVNVSGTTNHTVQVGNAGGSLTSLAVGTNGQVLIGATGLNPAFATITSAGGTIAFTPGANTLNMEVATPVVFPITVPQGGTGLTAVTIHNLLVGNGTSALNLIAPSATAGIPLISQGVSLDPLFGTAVVAGGGTGNTTFTAFSVITAGTTSTGPFQNVVGVGTSGQVLTSNGAGLLPSWQAASAGFLPWTEVTGTTQAMAVNNGYIANNVGLVTLTLPATAALGSIIRVTGKGAGLFSIAQNAGQQIHFGTQNTTVGVTGSITATAQFDSIELVCITANTTFNVLSSQGNLTVA